MSVMRGPLRLFSMLLFAASAVCGFAQIGGAPQGIVWRTVMMGERSAVKTQSVLVMESEGAFQTYWTRNTGNPPETAPKTIDWAKQKLVAVHLGERPTTGYSLLVTGITRNLDGNAVISVLERAPTPGQFVGQTITSPFALLAVDRAPVRFVLSVRQQTPPGVIGGGRPPARCGCTCGCPCCG
jgi:hypothetical protein